MGALSNDIICTASQSSLKFQLFYGLLIYKTLYALCSNRSAVHLKQLIKTDCGNFTAVAILRMLTILCLNAYNYFLGFCDLIVDFLLHFYRGISILLVLLQLVMEG